MTKFAFIAEIFRVSWLVIDNHKPYNQFDKAFFTHTLSLHDASKTRRIRIHFASACCDADNQAFD